MKTQVTLFGGPNCGGKVSAYEPLPEVLPVVESGETTVDWRLAVLPSGERVYAHPRAHGALFASQEGPEGQSTED